MRKTHIGIHEVSYIFIGESCRVPACESRHVAALQTQVCLFFIYCALRDKNCRMFSLPLGGHGGVVG